MSPMYELYTDAHKAGDAAMDKCDPIPMIVGTAVNPLSSDIDYTKPVYRVPGGVCGFAWVKIFPARGPFVAFCKKYNLGYTDTFNGGFRVNPFGHASITQSMALKAAYCRGFAEHLRKHGITCYVETQID